MVQGDFKQTMLESQVLRAEWGMCRKGGGRRGGAGGTQRLQQEAQVGGDEVERWGGNEDGSGGTSGGLLRGWEGTPSPAPVSGVCRMNE